MLEMLCALPAPCGGEEIAKKYIMQKFPVFQEDEIGNLVGHFPGKGEKVMLYAPLDEDAAVAMDVQGDKVYFAHLGSKKIYPSMQVSFGGYTGLVCSEGENPEEKQYIRLLDGGEGIEPGRNGVFEGNFEGETDKPENVLLGKNIAARAAISAMLQEFQSDYDVYLVFGVQSNHGNKGLAAAAKTIQPDKLLLFEETEQEKMTVKLLASGYSASLQMEAELKETLDTCGIAYTCSADSSEKTAGSSAPWGNCGVLGIPVLFRDFVRQGISVQTVRDLEKFVKCYLEGKNGTAD